jgi:hypothetical protein
VSGLAGWRGWGSRCHKLPSPRRHWISRRRAAGVEARRCPISTTPTPASGISIRSVVIPLRRGAVAEGSCLPLGALSTGTCERSTTLLFAIATSTS